MSRTFWAYQRSNRFFLLAFDFIVLTAFVYLFYRWRVAGSIFSDINNPIYYLFAIGLLALVYIFGGYEVERYTRNRDAFMSVGVATLIFAGVTTFFIYLGIGERAGLFGRGILLGSLFSFFWVGSFVRWVLFKSLSRLQAKMNWVFAVSERWSERLKKDLGSSWFTAQYTILDDKQLGDFSKYIQQKNTAFVVGLERETFASNSEIFSQVLEARLQGHQVMDLMAFYERFWLKIPVQTIAPEWLVQAGGFRLFQAPVRLKLKRLLDLAFSVLLLLVTWPFMLLAAIAIKLESPGPALYRQTRTGRGGEPFTIYKFRSMRNDAEKHGAQWAQVGDARITRVGNFLRKTRIDELPQLFNVIKGEMSFVGPRPERPEFNENLEKQIPFYNLRHLVNPGITGWAQILYPYGASAEDALEKLQFDIFYIKNYSFWLDIKIALKTARVVILGRGR